jgi:hypothetical protein
MFLFIKSAYLLALPGIGGTTGGATVSAGTGGTANCAGRDAIGGATASGILKVPGGGVTAGGETSPSTTFLSSRFSHQFMSPSSSG